MYRPQLNYCYHLLLSPTICTRHRQQIQKTIDPLTVNISHTPPKPRVSHNFIIFYFDNERICLLRKIFFFGG